MDRTLLSQFLEATFLVFKAFFWSLVKDLEMPLLVLMASTLFYWLASLVFLEAILTVSALGLSCCIVLLFLRGFFFYCLCSTKFSLVGLTADCTSLELMILEISGLLNTALSI